jgi:hypothetical protein
VAPDLGDELDVVGRKDCTQRNCPDDKMKKWADRIGHGTVIAGIIGAKNNGKGIIGVAPGAKINSLRVTDGREALSNLSFVNNALTWLDDNVTNDNEPATPSPGDVVNLSLGLGWSPLTTSAQAGIELLVGKLADKGLKVSIAAGNIDTLDGQGYVQAISPARAGGYENTGSGGAVRTASGIDANDEFWKFSAFGNFLLNTSGVQQKGPPDFAEPAADIISIWPGKELARCSGTSLAAAYLSGLLLWGKPKDGGPVKSDPSALEPGSAASAPVYDPTRAEPIGVMQ